MTKVFVSCVWLAEFRCKRTPMTGLEKLHRSGKPVHERQLWAENGHVGRRLSKDYGGLLEESF